MRVTLTFDNGPDEVGTPAALDELRLRSLPAVFFVVGRKVSAHPGLTMQIAADGHLVGNHTWSHSMAFGEAEEAGFARREIARTHEIIAEVATRPVLFRPVGAAPGAVIDDRLFNVEAVDTLSEYGYTVVLWNVVPRDWEEPEAWLEPALEGCRAVEHAVVVLHDGHAQGMAVLPSFLDALLDEAAEFSTDFPPSCIPMRTGQAQPSLTPLIAPLSKEFQ